MPNLVNSVDILALRHVKQGIDTGRYGAIQPLVQPLHMLISDTKIIGHNHHGHHSEGLDNYTQ